MLRRLRLGVSRQGRAPPSDIAGPAADAALTHCTERVIQMTMKAQQARSDERDNKRVFRWGVGAAIVVFLLALAYNLLTQTREEGPVKPDTPTQSAPQPTTTGTPASPQAPAPAPAR
jgi:hypothetical protein